LIAKKNSSASGWKSRSSKQDWEAQVFSFSEWYDLFFRFISSICAAKYVNKIHTINRMSTLRLFFNL